MSEDVNKQNIVDSETRSQQSDKELNFRKLEAAREAEKEARIRAEMEAQYLKREMDAIRASMQPKEVDPLDDLSEDDYQEPAKLSSKIKEKLNKERQHFRREAEEIANKVIEERDKKDYFRRLKQDYHDFDQVVNETNLAQLAESSPELTESLMKIPDEYEKRRLAYSAIKRMGKKEEPKASIKEKVQENSHNTYYTPQSAGVPTAADYDLKSPQARQAAYEKLKLAQRRPIGNAAAQR